MKTGNRRGGISTIAALLTLLSLAAMGAVISYLVSAGEEGRANHLLSSQAFYVTQAGVEYAIKRVYDGQNEIVTAPGKTFGRGSFTVSRSGLTLTVTSTVGNATRVDKIDSPTQADCITIDASNVDSGDGKDIKHIYLHKICLPQVVIDKMTISWVADGGQKMTLIQIESSKVLDNPTGVSSGTLNDIADYTISNGNNNVINHIKFKTSVSNTTMTMTLTMGDGTTKSATFNIEED